jgi:hypothetical protein
VRQLWIRPADNLLPLQTSAVTAIANEGLDEDCHRDSLSPRQVLITSDLPYDILKLPHNTLRENIRIGGDLRKVNSGSALFIGQVILWITFECEPCAKLNSHRLGLMKQVNGMRGVLARVIKGGRINEGDVVHYAQDYFPCWSNSWQERLRFVETQLPLGSIIDYGHLARLIGVPQSYCRAFPRLLSGQNNVVSREEMMSRTQPRWNGDELFVQSTTS